MRKGKRRAEGGFAKDLTFDYHVKNREERLERGLARQGHSMSKGMVHKHHLKTLKNETSLEFPTCEEESA